MLEKCFCNKVADCECKIYKAIKDSKMRCFDCAWTWLEDTSRCPKCGGTIAIHEDKKCDYGKSKKDGALDRGFTVHSKFGNLVLGDYRLWITTPSFWKHDANYNDYKLVLLTKVDSYGWNMYVHIPKSEFGDMFKLDRRNMPTTDTDPVEFRHYEVVKDHQLPMWKLSNKHVDELIARCLGAQP